MIKYQKKSLYRAPKNSTVSLCPLQKFCFVGPSTCLKGDKRAEHLVGVVAANLERVSVKVSIWKVEHEEK